MGHGRMEEEEAMESTEGKGSRVGYLFQIKIFLGGNNGKNQNSMVYSNCGSRLQADK
jgi:hypothetical protein